MLRYGILSLLLAVSTLVASEDEDIEIEVDFILNAGRGPSYELKCDGTNGTVTVDNSEREIVLTAAQQAALLAALQSEVKRYRVAPRVFTSIETSTHGVAGEHVAVQYKYWGPGSELEIELDLPFGEPSELSRDMLRVIREYFGISLNIPKRP
jgi:hypothetical protein